MAFVTTDLLWIAANTHPHILRREKSKHVNGIVGNADLEVLNSSVRFLFPLCYRYSLTVKQSRPA